MSKEQDAYEVKKQEKIDAIADMKDAKKALTKFRRENSLKAGEEPENAKLLKTYNKLVAAVEKQEALVEKVKAELKELAPPKKGGFATKYTYPTVVDEDSGEEREMTAKEKKAFRTKARADKKKAEKGDKPAKKQKAEKSAKKEKVVKKSKKKEKAAAEEEDDD
jgi:hypothetical protein